MARGLTSWGRIFDYDHQIIQISSASDISDYLTTRVSGSALAYGKGRSYGDSNLNSSGTLLKTTRLKAFLDADWEAGVVKVQSGITLEELLQVCVPKGWFLPVSPGTKFVTLGGAVANNIHGKNHHKVGSFGNFVRALSLHRSDLKNSPLICTPLQNKKLYDLTIGGLGLSGIIEWVEIQLKPISSSFLHVENIPYNSLAEFIELSKSSQDWEYSVAWVDCFSLGKTLGRGIFSRANFSEVGTLDTHKSQSRLTWPFVTPSFFLNKTSIKVFNWLYRKRPGAKYCGDTHYDSFFYPLDGINNWNKLYGKKGFYQHQCIINSAQGEAAITEILKVIESSGQGSFLAVLKLHGPETSPGKMSFCMEGLSLALDFPNKGDKTTALLNKIDTIVEKYSGRLYPAKDGHMSAKHFQSSYPHWKYLEQHKDPVLSSSFWRRVTKAV